MRLLIPSLIACAGLCSTSFATNPLQGLGLLPNGAPSGTAAGVRFDMSADGTTFVKANYRWNAGSWQTIPLAVGQSFESYGVSGDGSVVVGKVQDTSFQPFSAAVWRNNTFYLMDSTGFAGPDAPASIYANNDGSVVLGHGFNPSQGTTSRTKYNWNGSTYVASGFPFNDDMGQNFGNADEQGWRGIADNGSAGLGYNIGPTDVYANRHSTSSGPAFDRPPALNVPPGNTFLDERVRPAAMSGNGLVVVGRYEWSIIGPQGSSGNQPFRWSNGITTLMPSMPLGTEMDFVGEFLAAGASVYVASAAATFPVLTFLQNNGVDTTGWSNLTCTEVSSDGLCFSGVGTHTVNSVATSEIWTIRIPSPGSLAFVALGALCVCSRRRH